MRSCIFSIITPDFSVTWSSEIILICWFAAQETFMIIINVENSYIFVVFSGTFDQFNASLMNKSINFFLKSTLLTKLLYSNVY